MLYVNPIMGSYDELFDFIRTNRLLAESVGRFVPCVKTPEDVIRLIAHAGSRSWPGGAAP